MQEANPPFASRLFYLDWLSNHKNYFYKLVLDKLGSNEADNIEWSNPRVLCIAPDFNKYDEGAINLMPKDIELIKWKLFDKTSLIFEYFKQSSKKANKSVGSSETSQTSFPEKLNSASKKVKELFECINSFLNDELSDDATSNDLKHYRAYKRMKNFACVVVEKEKIVVYLSLDPKEYPVDEGFLRDMTNKGHLGTGDLEITIKTTADFEKSKTYFRASYNNN